MPAIESENFFHYTYQDYKQWDGDWELIDGKAVAMAPSPFGPHQGILVRIASDIGSGLRQCKKECFVYAELDYVVDEFNVLRPDLSVVCKKVEEFIRTPPKMVVEILSPSTAMKDKRIKYDIYEKEGVEYYLMIDYHLKQVKLYKLIDFHYQKIDDKDEGTMIVEMENCRIELNIDVWWEIL